MNTRPDPIFSEFETPEDAAAYDQWFRAKVEKSLKAADDPQTPRYSSDEVMRRIHTSLKPETA
ncbi:MAG: hypothetical protein QM533_00645 [Cytophagales bacterium]|nr:hypothetical protein [Cytophagales bacterium]